VQSSSRNDTDQPSLASMNSMSTLWRGAQRAQYRSPGLWLGSAGSETLGAADLACQPHPSCQRTLSAHRRKACLRHCGIFAPAVLPVCGERSLRSAQIMGRGRGVHFGGTGVGCGVRDSSAWGRDGGGGGDGWLGRLRVKGWVRRLEPTHARCA
jgi:hypothetical protein